MGPLLDFDTPDFVLRSLVRGDESESWGAWLANPAAAAMVNAVPRTRTLAELRTYIDAFDRINRHLFGIFDKTTGRLIGIRTVEIDRSRRAFAVHMMVGARTDWGRGSMDQTTQVLNDWAYETCDLLWSEASVLDINRKMVRYLCSSGWSIVRKDLARGAMDGRLIELVALHRHRDVWRLDPRSCAMSGQPAPTGLKRGSA